MTQFQNAPLAPPPVSASRPLRDPHTDRNRRRTLALVACAVGTVAVSAFAVVSTLGYEHTPDFVTVVNGDDRLKEFTRLPDAEIRQIARRVCVDLEGGSTAFATADALRADLHLTGVAGTTFVDAAIAHGCPEHAST